MSGLKYVGQLTTPRAASHLLMSCLGLSSGESRKLRLDLEQIDYSSKV